MWVSGCMNATNHTCSGCSSSMSPGAAGSDAALLVQIMFYYRVFAPLRDPIIDQLEARTSDHVAAPR